MSHPLLVTSEALSKIYDAKIYLKPEWHGPTGSHKDKWAQAAINLAIGRGAKKVVVMSSGNQGLAAAAAAFRKNLECCIVTETQDPIYLGLFKQYKAHILQTEESQKSLAFKQCVENGYFPLGITIQERKEGDLPAIEGYGLTADEITQQLNPDIVIFPTSYADHSEGALRRFQTLRENGTIKSIPQFILARAKIPEGDQAFSIETSETTPYVTHVLEATQGKSFFLTNEEMTQAQSLIKSHHQWNIELSSAASVACLRKLPPQDIAKKSIVVVLTALDRH